MKLNPNEVAGTIDHTFLRPDGRKEDIERLCKEAREYGFCAVVVAPCFVREASSLLMDTDVGVGTVIGFPLGFTTVAVKCREAEEVLKSGATELDMVINIAMVKDHRWPAVKSELRAVSSLGGETFKVILETCYLTEEEIVQVTRICRNLEGIDFVKTSTGFGPGGARAEDVAIMKRESGGILKVKASGGIRTKEDYLNMCRAGADRIGTSSGVEIVEAFCRA